jgi:arylformamidase
MGTLLLEHHDQWYRCQLSQGKSIAIELHFDGQQPNFFGAPPAASGPLQLGQFIGDISQGGACNVSEIKMVPHCNGTHTETVQHIVDQLIPVGRKALEGFYLGVLVSLGTTPADQTRETYRPALEPGDLLITAAALQEAIRPYAVSQPAALIIRTLPNVRDKLHQSYDQQNAPPFMTVECLDVISKLGITHLLVDFPSIDRMYDQGKLTNHHLFWNVPENTHHLVDGSYRDKTITEFIYVDDSLADGIVLLNLQVPPFTGDAAPSRPMLWPLEEIIR